MFRLIGLAEEAGSGMAKIIQSWRALGFQLPAIDVGTERYEFSLELRYAHFLREEDRTWLLSLGGDWSEPEQLALVSARHKGTIDNLTLRSVTGLHSTDATRVLRGLRDREFLQMVGGGRTARYELSPQALSVAVQVALPFDNTDTASSVGKVANSTDSDVNSTDNDARSTGTDDSSVDVHQLLQEIARPSRERRRLNAATRDDILVKLCTIQPLSLRELSRLMDRDEGALREIVRSLVSNQQLSFLYPDRPNHPQQKYTAAQ